MKLSRTRLFKIQRIYRGNVGSNTVERCFTAAFVMVNNQMVINGAEMMLIYGDLSCFRYKDWSLAGIPGSGLWNAS